MNRSHGLLSEQQNNATQGLIRGRRSSMWTWQISATVCCLAGGILAPLMGSLMLAEAWLTGNQHSGLSAYGIGTVLLLSTIPLLVLGAHCLDLSDRRKARDQQHHQDGPPTVANGQRLTQVGFAGLAGFLLLLCGFSTTTQAQQTNFNEPIVREIVGLEQSDPTLPNLCAAPVRRSL